MFSDTEKYLEGEEKTEPMIRDRGPELVTIYEVRASSMRINANIPFVCNGSTTLQYHQGEEPRRKVTLAVKVRPKRYTSTR